MNENERDELVDVLEEKTRLNDSALNLVAMDREARQNQRASWLIAFEELSAIQKALTAAAILYREESVQGRMQPGVILEIAISKFYLAHDGHGGLNMSLATQVAGRIIEQRYAAYDSDVVSLTLPDATLDQLRKAGLIE